MSQLIYIIEKGSVYEGGGVVCASLNYDVIREKALELVAKEQEELSQTIERTKQKYGMILSIHYNENKELRSWKEIEKDYWTDEYDYIQIKTLTGL